MSPTATLDARTIGDTLDNYERRWGGMLTAGKIAEPLVKALYWKRQVWAQIEVISGLEKPSWAYDVESDHLADLRDEYRSIITSAWLEFLSRHPTFGHKPVYQNAVSEQDEKAVA